jgi:AraC-like DNA-binding protein
MQQSRVVNRLETIRSKQPWLVLSAAEKFSLAGSDSPAISHFYSFETTDVNQETIAIPDGCVDIIFDCDSSGATAEVFGTPMKAIDIKLDRQHRYFGVRFVSGVMPDCLDISAEELIEHHFSLQDVIPHANQLIDTIVEETNFAAQVRLFKQFFERKTVRKLSPLTQTIVSFTLEHQGNIRIDELADLTGYTTRTIQRQFRADMGMSPKAFGRIIRCQCAVYDLNHKDKITFSDLACDLGFSDQSHFLHEFKKLVSTTPLDYLHRVKHETYTSRIQYY